ncbi:MAG: 5-formyltetrahydrofolate cyclo-ligase [Phycisphaerales bacterium JB040]
MSRTGDAAPGKRELRASARARLDALPPDAQRVASARIRAHLRGLDAWAGATSVIAYLCEGTGEPDLDDLLREGIASGKTIALPRMDWEARAMTPRVPPGLDAVEVRRHGVREPLENAPALDPGRAELVLVPGLAFDRSGGRLGRGAGFSARFLGSAELSTSAPVLGVCFAEQLVDRVPRDTHDVGVGMLVTQEGVLRTQ